MTLVIASQAGIARADDFDPHGRRHHPPPKPAPGHVSPRPHAPEAPAADASSAVLVQRYTRVVLAQPGAPFPLQRLAQLYRDRDGKLNALVADFEARAAQAGPDQYAATVTLAGLQKLDGHQDEAIKTYERAAALKPTDPAALLALARTLQDRGDLVGARPRYEQALTLQKLPVDRVQTLRTLMALTLDAQDWTSAAKYHAELVKAEPTSLFVRGELGRELFARGEYERAESELRDLVTASQGDNRTLAPALKDLGKTLAKEHKSADAIATLKRGLAIAGPQAAVRKEIYETLTEVYRADQKLPEWIKDLEASHPTDFERLAILGSLYEETGDAERALKTYQRALAVSPRQIDLRLKMIRLLQSQGELGKAIAEYEGVIRAAPNNPQFVFEECEALLQRGDRARALELVKALEARAGDDEDVLSRVADFYGRIGEGERSTKVLARLAQSTAGRDPSHLVDLGDRYFQDGNSQLALQTWKKILVLVQPRARALATIGDVYLEHDMTADALAALREAVQLEPANVGYRKQLASALERARAYREARSLWEQLAQKAKETKDRGLARETRTHIVTLWALERTLEIQLAPLASQLNSNPPDAEAGRTLADVQLHLRRLPDAEATLRRVIDLAPGDGDTYLALERVLVQEEKYEDAIAILKRLVVVEPKRERELYQRMAEYAMRRYHDDEAIEYAAHAVALSPDDAEAHKRLGEMYRSRQDVARAIVEFRAAIAKNDRLYPVYFDLADLLMARGDDEGADRLLRHVVRAAPDDELIARAASASIQNNLGRGTLESLEQDLLPLAIGNPQKPIYRRKLVEIYGSMTYGLVQRVRRARAIAATEEETKDAAEARATLAKIGARAVKPLLDALADGDAGQQRIAIDVLGYVQNKNAGPALFSFATGSGDTTLRSRAMIACGALDDGALLPRYGAYLAPKRTTDGVEEMPTDGVAVAATWGVARMKDKRSLPLLRLLSKRGTPEMRALAVLGLGEAKDKASVGAIAAIAKEPGAGNVARAAAAFALGRLGADQERAALLVLADGPDALARQMALAGLAELGRAQGMEADRASLAAMADAAFAGGDAESARSIAAAEGVRRAGAGALALVASKRARPDRDVLPVPDDAIDVEAILARLVPSGFTKEELASTLVTLRGPVERAATTALQTSSDARAVLDALAGGDGTLAPFVDAQSTDAAAHEAARSIARALEPAIAGLARHPDPSMRTKAILLLSHWSTPAASAAVVDAVSDPSEAVERVALAAIGAQADPRAVAAVSHVMAGHESWAMRVLAVEAMGRLGAAGARKDAADALRSAATRDAYALVREAALGALATFDVDSARTLARTLASTDPEPRVRDAAIRIARGGAASSP